MFQSHLSGWAINVRCTVFHINFKLLEIPEATRLNHSQVISSTKTGDSYHYFTDHQKKAYFSLPRHYMPQRFIHLGVTEPLYILEKILLPKQTMFEEQLFLVISKFSLKIFILPLFFIIVGDWAERCVEATLQCEKPSYYLDWSK